MKVVFILFVTAIVMCVGNRTHGVHKHIHARTGLKPERDAGRAFGVWNNKDSTFQFKLPSGIYTADVTFMGTSGVHKFHFTTDSTKASHVAWEHLYYDHTADAFLLDCTFTHCGKHPQVVQLPLPRITGCTEFYNPTRPSHLVYGAFVRHCRSYSPTEIRSMQTIGLEQSPAYFSRRAQSASRTPSGMCSCTIPFPVIVL